MFLFRASRYVEELNSSRPDILDKCSASVFEVATDLDFTRVNKKIFEECPAESIDYAVMEKLHTQLWSR